MAFRKSEKRRFGVVGVGGGVERCFKEMRWGPTSVYCEGVVFFPLKVWPVGKVNGVEGVAGLGALREEDGKVRKREKIMEKEKKYLNNKK